MKQLLREKDLESALWHDLLKKLPSWTDGQEPIGGSSRNTHSRLSVGGSGSGPVLRMERSETASWTPKRGGGRPRRGSVGTINDTKVAERQVLEWLSALIIAGDGQAYGYRQWTTWLRREHGLITNKKTVYRLLRSADLLQEQPLRPSGNRLPRVLAVNRVVTGPNPLGEIDWKYGYIAGEDRFFISVVPLIGVCRTTVPIVMCLRFGAYADRRKRVGRLLLPYSFVLPLHKCHSALFMPCGLIS
ncbi:MAG: hypothetical protein C7B47_13780 [Sulfobacillus thermosulfidooxidans]|uniref:HTH-like domain-containing protein n=1 Tax=Sulfobacillus thermosulfidooxidans TaxID=28034 RepID=A0A2T2WRJ7_SULTH|nr:MAG: hypothetical protein C7B47_13780 [Sulfobacillus thermosulfidooxidans]